MLEIHYKDLYRAVCNDNFGDSEAATVCHQLGFAGAGQVVPCCCYMADVFMVRPGRMM